MERNNLLNQADCSEDYLSHIEGSVELNPTVEGVINDEGYCVDVNETYMVADFNP